MFLVAAWSGPIVDLEPHTLRAFLRYAELTEHRVLEHATMNGEFLYLDYLPAARREQIFDEMRSGSTFMDRLRTLDGDGEEIDVDDGLIHHWLGAVYIDGVTLDETLALIQDYDRHSQIYAPEVVDARILERDGGDFRVFMRFRKTKVITVVLDTEHDVEYVTPAAGRTYSLSRTTSVRQVEDPGEPEERILADGEGSGFLWRLNSYWRFLERDGGVYIECESITLTRTIPFMLRWLVGPFVNDVPREQLEALLETTRQSLAGS